MELFIGVIIFLIGCCLGSFVNMLVYRTAVSYKVIKLKVPKVGDKNRSFCDYCGNKLSWYENIPVISWLVQGGRTRCCGKGLDWSYPLVEMVTGLMLWGVYIRFPSIHWWQVGLVAVMVAMLVFLVVFDWKYMIMPDFAVGTLITFALAGVVFDEGNIVPYLISALIGSGFLGAIHLLTRGNGMGLGDVKYAIFMGLLLGPTKTIIAFYLAFVLGAVVAIGLVITRRAGRKSQIAFGPFLILGTVIAWWWGERILGIWHFL